jgi:hypothetical protein
MASCKVDARNEQAPAHPAEPRAAEFLDALKYGDADRAAALHIESTANGFYCGSDRFAEVLEMARVKRSDAECARLAEAGDERLAELNAEARLLVQIVRFSCEYPKGDCAAYGEKVFKSHLAAELDRPSFHWRSGDWSIRKVMGDDNEAIVYVDLRPSQGKKAAFETLSMKRIDGQWYVAESFADEDRMPAN